MAKPAAAWLGKNSYKNGIAKVMRQAHAQSHQKTATINTAPAHEAIIYVASAFGLRICRKGWSLSIFCCILFFKQSITFYEAHYQIVHRMEQHQPHLLHGPGKRFKRRKLSPKVLQAAACLHHAAWQALPTL